MYNKMCKRRVVKNNEEFLINDDEVTENEFWEELKKIRRAHHMTGKMSGISGEPRANYWREGYGDDILVSFDDDWIDFVREDGNIIYRLKKINKINYDVDLSKLIWDWCSF